jgi:hypothetical protein
MAGPWEKYQKPESGGGKPWEKFAPTSQSAEGTGRTKEDIEAHMRSAHPEAYAHPDAPTDWAGVAENVTINDILGGPLMGAVDTVKSLWNDPKGTIGGMFTHPVEQAKKSYDAFKKGDTWEGAQRAANAVPFIGSVGESADINHPGRVIGNTALAAASSIPSGRALMGEGAGAVNDATKTARATVKGAVKAGGPEIAKGAVKVGTGAAMDAIGVPGHVGTILGVKEGIGDIASGVRSAVRGGREGFRGAQAERRIANAGPRAEPAWSSLPKTEVMPPPEVSPIPGQLPSGRVPGGVQNIPEPKPSVVRAEPAWSSLPKTEVMPPPEVSPIPTESAPPALPSGRVPGRMKPEGAPSPQVQPSPMPPPAPAAGVVWDPIRGHVDASTGRAPLRATPENIMAAEDLVARTNKTPKAYLGGEAEVSPAAMANRASIADRAANRIARDGYTQASIKALSKQDQALFWDKLAREGVSKQKGYTFSPETIDSIMARLPKGSKNSPKPPTFEQTLQQSIEQARKGKK